MSNTESRSLNHSLPQEVGTKSKESDTLPPKMRLKYASLVILVVQNTLLVLVMRYSRTMEGPRYLASTAVVFVELLKVLTCAVMVLHQNSWNLESFVSELRTEIVENYQETLKVSVPSCLYTIQNNLLYLALTNLDAATFQVTYQLKIITTALFSVILLRKKLIQTQWISLVMLTVAVALVQWPADSASANGDGDAEHSGFSLSHIYGLIAVLLACISSGFSGVYFEKMLKGSETSLWVRNIQLGLFGIFFAITGVILNDHEAVRTNGFLVGYNYVVVLVIVLQAMGGLVVAAVIKYADNILKGFASAISIVLSSILSYLVLQDFVPSTFFIFGVVLVIASTFLYGRRPPKPSPILSTTTSGNTSSGSVMQLPYPPPHVMSTVSTSS